MQLLDVVARTPTPAPWSEGDNIVWHEPGFSERMLREHLSQEHDAASRRTPIIDADVRWIHTALLGTRPARTLDLGCGPGLYSERLARLGHRCVGVDYSPASLAYARARAAEQGLDCTYVEGDLRRADYGEGFDLAMQIYGELNVFSRADALHILRRTHAALAPGGAVLLEPSPEAWVRRLGAAPRRWYTSSGGLFSAAPHLVLEEHTWCEEVRAATIRYYVVDAATAEVTRYAQTFQAYSDDEYRTLLEEAGFTDVALLPALGGSEPSDALMAITARRGERP